MKNQKKITNNTLNMLYKNGSVEFQIIQLTKKINNLQKHFNTNKHDFNNKRYFLKIISRRKRFMNYIKFKKFDIYKNLLINLKLKK